MERFTTLVQSHKQISVLIRLTVLGTSAPEALCFLKQVDLLFFSFSCYLTKANTTYFSVSQLKQSPMRESERWSPFGQFSGCIISAVDTSTICFTKEKQSAEVHRVSIYLFILVSTFSYLLYHFYSISYDNSF